MDASAAARAHEASHETREWHKRMEEAGARMDARAAARAHEGSREYLEWLKMMDDYSSPTAVRSHTTSSFAHNDAPNHLIQMMLDSGADRRAQERALEAQRAVQRRERAEEDEARDEAERKRKAIAAARWDAERSMSPEERAYVAASARAAARAAGGAGARRKY